MAIEFVITLPWSEEKQNKLIGQGHYLSEPYNLFRKTHTGAQEQLQFKVEVVRMSTWNMLNGFAVRLHCLQGQNITVWWSYKVKGRAELSVVDKAVFPRPGYIDIGDARVADGALHKDIFSQNQVLYSRNKYGGESYFSLEVLVKVQEEQDEQSVEEKRNVSIQDDIVNDLSNLFKSSDTADVHLICQGTKFPCHRLLLAARSSVFKTMFFGQGDYKEGKEGQVTIDEFEPQEIKQLLRFIYCGECEFKEVDPWHILALSDMYDVQMLNKVCCQVLAIKYMGCFHFSCVDLNVLLISYRS